jgi:hypothetical protein
MSTSSEGIHFSSLASAERLESPVGDAAVWRLGYDEDPVRPGFMHVRWGPGEGSPEHRHKSWTANVILRGTLRIGERWFQTGDVAVIEPNIWYGPLEAGPEGAEILEIHATIPGVEAIWRDPDHPDVRSVVKWLEQTGKAAWKD